MKFIYLTKDEYKKLERELDHLKRVERPKVIRSVAEAREQGDLRENAGYDAAKEDQSLLESKILKLEDLLARARIFDNKEVPTDKVYLGNKVVLLDLDTDEKLEYVLVSTTDVDFDMNMVSLGSPVGKTLVGKSVGDVFEIGTSTGKIRYKILDILKP